MTQLNSDFYCFPFFFFAPSFVEKKVSLRGSSYSCQQHVPVPFFFYFVLELLDNCQMFVIFVGDLWSSKQVWW